MRTTNIDPASTLHTDGAQHYEASWPLVQREAVNHNKEFVRDGRDGEKVQAAADTMNDDPGVGTQDERYRLYVAEAEKVLSKLRIDITEDCKRITLLPGGNPPLQVWEIGYSPIDGGLGI